MELENRILKTREVIFILRVLVKQVKYLEIVEKELHPRGQELDNDRVKLFLAMGLVTEMVSDKDQ